MPPVKQGSYPAVCCYFYAALACGVSTLEVVNKRFGLVHNGDIDGCLWLFGENSHVHLNHWRVKISLSLKQASAQRVWSHPTAGQLAAKLTCGSNGNTPQAGLALKRIHRILYTLLSSGGWRPCWSYAIILSHYSPLWWLACRFLCSHTIHPPCHFNGTCFCF